MDTSLAHIIFQLFELALLIGFTVWVINLSWSLLHGAPFIRIKLGDVFTIFDELDLQPGTRFLELGCGDGRVVTMAVKRYGVIGRGIDIAPLWLAIARIRSRLERVRVDFRRENILATDLSWAQVIYVFMLPKFLDQKIFADKLTRELRPGTTVVSYGFPLDILTPYLTKTLDTRDYKTYVYRVRSPASPSA